MNDGLSHHRAGDDPCSGRHKRGARLTQGGGQNDAPFRGDVRRRFRGRLLVRHDDGFPAGTGGPGAAQGTGGAVATARYCPHPRCRRTRAPPITSGHGPVVLPNGPASQASLLLQPDAESRPTEDQRHWRSAGHDGAHAQLLPGPRLGGRRREPVRVVGYYDTVGVQPPPAPITAGSGGTGRAHLHQVDARQDPGGC